MLPVLFCNATTPPCALPSCPSLWALVDTWERYVVTTKMGFEYDLRTGRRYWNFYEFLMHVIRGRQPQFFHVWLGFYLDPEQGGATMRITEGGCSISHPSISAPTLDACLKLGFAQSPALAQYLGEEHVQAHPTRPATFRVIHPLPAPRAADDEGAGGSA
jgi:hypothetical protein